MAKKITAFVNRIPFLVAMGLSIGLFMLLGALLSALLIQLINELELFLQSGDTGTTMLQDRAFNGEIVVIKYSQWMNTMNLIVGIVIPFVFCTSGAVAGAYIFYRWKMKQPLNELRKAVKKIQEKDLNFQLCYNASDELGALCKSFDMMREELHVSFTKMWRIQEDHKRLNSAFAHDLRTPLTILKGQTDVLKKKMARGSVDLDKAVHSLSIIQNSIERLERYVKEMTSLQSLEGMEPNKKEIVLCDFMEILSQHFATYTHDGKTIHIEVAYPSDRVISFDTDMVIQVIENLVSNALRFAKKHIEVILKSDKDHLIVTVKDDGKGFSHQSIHRGLEPFYREDMEKKDDHLGLGLNICKTITEKHGGSISLSNHTNGGGCVIVQFAT
ncbi:HAMP domain-containing sensor histidine kinase [Bacillus sp. 03113]|uniref:HAMP domain-containing sensor histidine kinase n=1 Tax=Bacillus sp. 03113 TaxID=2578211 RepID=UPI0015E8CC62|nr:HAMP domain-containing sensor histidine kinase [Bacillus sp. 03113]